jgi:hypothetical protein
MVGAFGDVVPGADECLELREGGVHLPGHGRLLRFLPDDLRLAMPSGTRGGHRLAVRKGRLGRDEDGGRSLPAGDGLGQPVGFERELAGD